MAGLTALYHSGPFDNTFVAHDENDGKGPYISQWNSTDPLPTNEQVEVALAAAEIAVIKEMRSAAYKAEADPLFFKAQRGEATNDEWLAKVAEIKVRFPDLEPK